MASSRLSRDALDVQHRQGLTSNCVRESRRWRRKTDCTVGAESAKKVSCLRVEAVSAYHPEDDMAKQRFRSLLCGHQWGTPYILNATRYDVLHISSRSAWVGSVEPNDGDGDYVSGSYKHGILATNGP